MATAKKSAPVPRTASASRKSTPVKAAAPSKKASPARKVSAARKAPIALQAAAPGKAEKPSKADKPSKAEKAAKSDKPARKEKLVRDSFTMPAADFGLIAAVKQRALGFQHVAKKSEVLRAGLVALQGLSEAQLRAILESLPVIKTGRPKKAN